MDNIEAEYKPVIALIKQYNIPKEKFLARYTALLKDITEYIKVSNWDEAKVVINKYSLGCMLVDYFLDVYRLKDFHSIDHVNSIKIVAYTAFWFLKRKPIQVLSDDENLLYVNEKFILIYILDYLTNEDNENILDRNEKGLEAFKDSLYYFLKYRPISAQALEMILMSFFAGQIYQSRDIDLSDKLPRSET